MATTRFLLLGVLSLVITACQAVVGPGRVTGDTSVHDPSMLVQPVYYHGDISG